MMFRNRNDNDKEPNINITNLDLNNKNEKIVRNNSIVKKTILGSGTFTCVIDIPPGRYAIKAKENSGNPTVTDNSNLIINSILDSIG